MTCYPINIKYVNCVIENREFTTINELQNEINSTFNDSIKGSGTLTLNNVTVTSGKGALSIPNGVTSVTSNNDLFNEIKFNDSTTKQSVVVSIPNATISVNEDYTNKSITFAGSSNTITINGKLASLGISGNNSSVTINNDLSGSVSFSGEVTASATISKNITVHCVNFNGSGNYTVTNKGTITNENGGGHVIYTQSPSTFTINNYGTIKNTKTGATYALLFYGNCNATFKAYAGSVLSTDYTNLIIAYSSAGSIKFMYENGATIDNAGVNKEYTSLAGSKVEVEKMAQN